MNKKSSVALFFLLIFLLPFIPVVTSLIDLRYSVIVDTPVNWAEGERIVISIPEVKFEHFEFRLESDESKWTPIVHGRWVLRDGNNEILDENLEGDEWNITRPFLNFVSSGENSPRQLEVEFLNANPEGHPIRLKISQDRTVLIQKSERLFIVLLALSLGLLLMTLKPLWSRTFIDENPGK